MIIIVILLLIIALPTLINIIASALGLFWLFDFISKYGRYILLSSILLALMVASFYLINNKETIRWNYFKNKSERICRKIIKKQFNNDPTISSRQVFDEIVKLWVPLANKVYPNVKPRELGIKLGITPNGIEDMMNNSAFKNK